MNKKGFLIRNTIVLFFFIIAIFLYLGRILNMQFANAEQYTRKVKTTYTRKHTIPAMRGEIYDRNGVLLVRNRNVYKIRINGISFKRTGYVQKIEELLALMDRCSQQPLPDSLPVTEITSQDGAVSYSYDMVPSSGSTERTWLDRYLVKNNLDTAISAQELISYFRTKFGLQNYSGTDLRRIIGICYDFDRQNILAGNIYVFASDVNMMTVSSIKENSHNFPGVEVLLGWEREYMYPDCAAHIIGTTGKIIKENYEKYKDNGYAMDAVVGRSGVEQAFEEYLRGIDGVIELTYDQDGNVVSEEYEKEPVAGKNVYLTIDIKLQQVAERSIENTIERIHDIAAGEKKPFSGEDANAGSAVLVNPDNGEIYCLATYPSYNINTYKTDYQSLLDDPRKPLVNRALGGEYPPGSIFKINTALAALCEGVITPSEEIYDKGIYTKYSDYQPRCWLYASTKRSHGNENVSRAIRDSCNYFFYTVSERMTIEKLNEYSRRIGLGVNTGIELGETKGILASREYKEAHQGAWFEGDLLQAAIGQSDNAFSPLQMAQMISTVLSDGNRYAMHLLLKVEEYGSGTPVKQSQRTVLDTTNISDATFNAIKNGMSDVIESGTAKSLFKSFDLKIGGKTGTAQIRKDQSNLGTFVCFAPFKQPEVAMSVVIERGSKGTYAGFVAEDVLYYYFGYRTYEEAMGLPPLEDAGVEE